MGRVDQSGIKPPEKHLDDFGKSAINIINRPSADHEKETLCSCRCCLATQPQDNTTQRGDTGGDLVEHSALGHVSIITGLTQSCVRTQSMFYREGF